MEASTTSPFNAFLSPQTHKCSHHHHAPQRYRTKIASMNTHSSTRTMNSSTITINSGSNSSLDGYLFGSFYKLAEQIRERTDKRTTQRREIGIGMESSKREGGEEEKKQSEKRKQIQNEGGGGSNLKGKSCKGYLYYSSTLKSNGINPRCIGIPRSLPQIPNYVGQSEDEASKDGRTLIDFYYGCAGYSVYANKDLSTDKQVAKTELPVCVGLELLVDRRVASEDSASAPAHIHHKEDGGELPQLQPRRELPQPRAQKPVYEKCKPGRIRGGQKHAKSGELRKR
ncbi:hypothetical protein NC653_013630 [Populus alba x Populus x berolinensis]|uniref:DUF8204 domain-containing protein n=1 Tax=Populus alba x Populus x berolinensis TaxID=444605 RepID=A0AAD6QV41_9ROSI|nr:hypothetical protein NC653_013630 [Populus alba x Populus x berolinensis]